MMHARHPDLYPDDLCALCRQATEDNDHIWTCPRSHNAQRIIWEEAVAVIPKWGRDAVRKVNADSQLRYAKVAKRDPTATPPTPLQWHQPDETLVWASLYSHFDGLRNFRPPSWGQDTALIDSPSTITSAYQGLLSPALITTWTRLFKTTSTVAAQVAHQLIRRLDRDALGRLWKTRCEATIAWEKTHGIRHSAKRQPYHGPRGPWNNSGYVCPQGMCNCGSPLQAHDGGSCPGARDDPLMADRRLLACLRGQVHLTLLEKMGKIPFL
jgi:hypothetical protein